MVLKKGSQAAVYDVIFWIALTQLLVCTQWKIPCQRVRPKIEPFSYLTTHPVLNSSAPSSPHTLSLKLPS